MPNTIRTEAIVVKRDELGESDRLITLLTRDQGKLRAVAPGARRSRRRFGGCLELFARIDVAIADKGAGRLARLEEAVLLRPHQGISTDLVRIAQASYITELTCALLAERDQAPGSFRLLDGALDALDTDVLPALELRAFELGMLGQVGLRPSWDACLVCGACRASSWVFDHAQGGVVCDACAGEQDPRCTEALDQQALELLRALCGDRSAPVPHGPGAMPAARALLAHIIDSHAGRPMRSRAFLRGLVTGS